MDTQQNPPAPAEQTKALMKSGPRDVKSLLASDEFRAQVAMALPRHLKPERFIRVALNATLRQPELLQCQRESLFLALLQLSAYGIEADGRRAHLIPFWDHKVCTCGHDMDKHRQGQCTVGKCQCTVAMKRRMVQLIIDYKGLVDLVRRSGDVSYIHADVVLEGDEWDFQFGSNAFLKHKPNLSLGTDRKMIAFYSFVKLKDGSDDFIVISKADVDAIRKRSKSKDSGPWVTDYAAMGMKTVFRRHSKWLPLSPETRDAIENDDEGENFSISAGTVLDGMSQVVADEPPEDEPAETLADRVKSAASKTTAGPEKPKDEPRQEAPEPEPAETKDTKWESWEAVKEAFEGDENAVELGKIVTVGGKDYTRDSFEHAWKVITPVGSSTGGRKPR